MAKKKETVGKAMAEESGKCRCVSCQLHSLAAVNFQGSAAIVSALQEVRGEGL